MREITHSELDVIAGGFTKENVGEIILTGFAVVAVGTLCGAFSNIFELTKDPIIAGAIGGATASFTFLSWTVTGMYTDFQVELIKQL